MPLASSTGLSRWRAKLNQFLGRLAYTEQACEVALVVGASLTGVIDLDRGGMLVVDDIVRQWNRRGDSQQQHGQESDFRSDVAAFAWQYLEDVATEAFASKRLHVYGDAADIAKIEHWQRHVAALRDLAEGREIGYQTILIGPGDQAVTRHATDQERQRFNLRSSSGVVELARTNGEVESTAANGGSSSRAGTGTQRRAARCCSHPQSRN